MGYKLFWVLINAFDVSAILFSCAKGLRYIFFKWHDKWDRSPYLAQECLNNSNDKCKMMESISVW